MLPLPVRVPAALALALVWPALGFGQYVPGVGVNPSNTGYNYRSPGYTPPPSYIGGPTYSGQSYFNPSYTGYDYRSLGNSNYPSSLPAYPGVYRPLGSGVDPYATLRFNFPDDVANDPVRQPAFGSTPRPVYVPRFDTTTSGSAEATVTVAVRVPADAEVWFDGKRTQQKGSERLFESPPLQAGKRYAYEIKARWTEDGKEVERTREVTVRAGERATADFVSPKP